VRLIGRFDPEEEYLDLMRGFSARLEKFGARAVARALRPTRGVSGRRHHRSSATSRRAFRTSEVS
jgi:hypothetical protein